MAMTEAQLRAQKRYQKRAIAQVLLKLHKENDADIIERLAQEPSKNGYLKRLVRQDIAARANETHANETASGPREQDEPADA